MGANIGTTVTAWILSSTGISSNVCNTDKAFFLFSDISSDRNNIVVYC